MPANILWDMLVSAFAGVSIVVRGALADAAGIPGRFVAPFAALMQNQYGSLNPALSAIVSGDVFPNLLLFASIGCVAFSEGVLSKRHSPNTFELAMEISMSLVGIVWRALFFADASIQCISIAASLAGQPHSLHSSFRLYFAQHTLLSAYCIPLFIIPVHRVHRSLQSILQFMFKAMHCCSFLRIAQLLEGSGASLIATCVTSFAAFYAVLSCIEFISHVAFTVKFQDGVQYNTRDWHLIREKQISMETKRMRFEDRGFSAARAFFFGTLSLCNHRPLMLDCIAGFFAFETLSPFSLEEFFKNRIFKPSFNIICSAVMWLHASAWPVIQRSLRASIEFFCRISVSFMILYEKTIVPLWCCLSPLAIPSVLACIAFNRASNFMRSPSLLAHFTDGVFAAAAAFSSAVLFIHAFTRVFHWHVDPFKYEALRWLGSKLCDFVLLPMDFTLKLLRMLWNHVLLPALVRVVLPTLKSMFRAICALISAVLSAIESAPIFSMTCIVVANVLVMYLCYSSATFAPIFSSLGRLIATCTSAATSFAYASLFFLLRVSTADNTVSDKDTTLALVILALIQMTCCVFIRRALRSCKPLPPFPASQQHMASLDLQALAESMNQPRQVPSFVSKHHTFACDQVTPISVLFALLVPSTISDAPT
jgi:hypothetical protein